MISRLASPASGNPLIRYVNVSINNLTGARNVNATFEHSYDRNVLEVAGDHLCAVDSFSLPLQNLPLFIFPVQVGQAAGPSQASTIQIGVTKNMTPATIISGATETVTHDLTALTWVPQDLSFSAVDQTGVSVPRISPYYFGYSYEHFVNLVNTALNTSWAAEGSPGGAGEVPVFAYDEVNNVFSFQLSDAFRNAVSSANGWSVCWNAAFDDLMNNFNVINNPQVQGTDFYMLENVLSSLTNRNAADDGCVFSQDYPTTDAFNSAQRIIVLTNSIPVAVDYFPSPFGQLQSGGLSNTENVLADVSLDFNNNVAYQRSLMVYAPENYQWSDLQSTLPLRRISVKFMWADAQNNFYDINMGISDHITIKLRFDNKKLHVHAM